MTKIEIICQKQWKTRKSNIFWEKHRKHEIGLKLKFIQIFLYIKLNKKQWIWYVFRAVRYKTLNDIISKNNNCFQTYDSLLKETDIYSIFIPNGCNWK